MVNYTKVFKFLTLLTICWSSILGDALAQTTTLSYTGAMQTYVVPAGITQITVDMSGAQGGNSQSFDAGGLGGRVQATLNVTPGQTLNIFVGGQGTNVGGTGVDMTAAGGFNGGGTGGFDLDPQVQNGGGGGGATDIRIGGTALANRVLVAGGGGGASTSATGGNGGGLTGGSGNSFINSVGGGGGTQAAGGSAFLGRGASAGALGVGGTGGSNVLAWGCGGGGGGYYGGGGGSSTTDHGSGYGASGGGGSSYSDGSFATGVTHTQGFRSGNGTVSLTVVCPIASAIINTNPFNTTVCQGTASTFFAVSATGTSLAYQWQMRTYNTTFVNVTNNATYSGATNSVLVINNPNTTMDGNTYRCVVTAGCALPTNSVDAMLTVNGQHTLLSNPTTVQVCSGSNASFTVNIGSQSTNPVTYQWQVAAFNSSTFTNIPAVAPYTGVNAATLTLTAPANALNGNNYRCVATTACGTPVVSTPAQLNIDIPPTVASHPQSTTICEGANVTFNVSAQGNSAFYPYNYTWQVNTGSGFANIAGGAPYSGLNSPNLTITNATLSMNNYQYRVVVSGNCTPSVTSNPAVLTINAKPAVTSNPVNMTICEDAAASFSVAATGTNVAYQWQVSAGGTAPYVNIGNTAPYAGMQTATLSITSAPASFAFNTYRCVVSGTCAPAVTSTAAELTIQRKPVITSNPVNFTTCSTSIQASYSVAATGTGLTYQWQSSATGVAGTFANLSNAGVYSGVTTNVLSITSGSMALNNSFYRCVVSGTCAPAAISSAAQLFINIPAAITNNPSSATVCEAGNTSFTTSATGTGITFQWQVNNGSGFTNVTNTGVYGGTTTATLNITGATNSMNNLVYRCNVTGVCGPIAVSANAVLTVNALTVINTQPSASTVCEGTNATFSIGATAGGINYQWQVNTGAGFVNITATAPYSGHQSSMLTILNTPASFNNYQYRCVVGSICGPTTNSNPVLLTVNTAPALTTAPAANTVCAGSPATFVASATGTGIGYQWQLNTGSGFSSLSNTGIYSGVTTGILSVSTTTAAMNGYTYRVVVSGTCAPAAMASAQLNVNTAPVINAQPLNTTVCTNGNTVISINASGTGVTYQWQVNTGSGFSNVTNTGVYAGATTPTLGITAAPFSMNGYTYRCIVSGTCPSTLTSNTITLTVLGLPTITASPVNTAACINAPVTFTVGATGNGLTYQWQVNTGSGFANLTGAPIYQGSNTATLTFFNVLATYNGYQFRCVVGGTCAPSVNSAAAILTTNTQPSVTTNPAATSTCAGSNAQFTIVATGTGITYQWQVNTAGGAYTNITNTGVYSGATSTTLVISGATANLHSNQYRCVVSGTCAPAVTSNFAILTVRTAPTVLSNPTDRIACAATNVSFTVNASGVNMAYQWQVNTGAAWSNIPNGGIYGGANTATLTASNITTAMRGYTYRCVVSNGCTPDAVSGVATLTVYGKPIIVSAPTSATTCEGSSATFNTVVDAWNPTFQWQVNNGTGWTNLTNGGNYSFVTTSTLMVSGVTAAMEGYQYRCVVTDACGINNTADGILHVDRKPVITKDPITQKGWYQDPFIFTVDATGTNLTFQWQIDTTGSGNYINIADKAGTYIGTTTNTLRVIPTYQNLRYFRCVVSGTCTPPVISKDAQIVVGFKTGIENIANNVSVNVYPNPVSGNTLNIQLGNYNNRSVVVKITNTLGAVVATEEVSLHSNTGSFNVGTLAAGTYNLQVADADNNTLQVIRFVKQ